MKPNPAMKDAGAGPPLRPAHPARYGRRLSSGRVRCDLCPHHCVLADGERGRCFLRFARAGRLETAGFGRITGLAVDPVEKKPLYHVLPGTTTLSFGAIGCPLCCDFCQNAPVSQPSDERALRRSLRPGQIADAALRLGCPSVSFTYNEPVASFEFVLAAAEACRARGLRTIAVTSGYIERDPGREFFSRMDAANVDLKAFTESFYRRHCGARLEPVLRTLERVVLREGCWLELTTLLIPGENDAPGDLDRMTRWIAGRLGPGVPLHFSAFFPAHRLRDRPPTPPETLRRARDQAKSNGLLYVYTGNVRDPEGQRTRCPDCGRTLIERDGFRVLRAGRGGVCPDCGAAVPGLWEGAAAPGPA